LSRKVSTPARWSKVVPGSIDLVDLLRGRHVSRGHPPDLPANQAQGHPLTDAGREQLGRAQPAGLQAVTFSLCRRAARDRCHAPDPHPHRQPTPPRPLTRTSLKTTPTLTPSGHGRATRGGPGARQEVVMVRRCACRAAGWRGGVTRRSPAAWDQDSEASGIHQDATPTSTTPGTTLHDEEQLHHGGAA
jgi:hypothetical protein